jgi:large subunit ribosomal protein L13
MNLKKTTNRPRKKEEIKERIINAENCIMGRLASSVAKRLMIGDTIHIVNAEKAVVSGNPRAAFDHYDEKVKRGDPVHGPFYPRRPDMIMKRVIRGMIPRRKAKGRDAFGRLKVYISVPEQFKSKKLEVLEKTVNRLDHKYTTLEKVSDKLGMKVEK